MGKSSAKTAGEMPLMAAISRCDRPSCRRWYSFRERPLAGLCHRRQQRKLARKPWGSAFQLTWPISFSVSGSPRVGVLPSNVTGVARSPPRFFGRRSSLPFDVADKLSVWLYYC
jgi:hypothetical protein